MLEAALADHHPQITLESINGKSPAEFFTLSVQDYATDWVAHMIRFGAHGGLGPEVSIPIIFETLNDILAVLGDRIEREGPKA